MRERLAPGGPSRVAPGTMAFAPELHLYVPRANIPPQVFDCNEFMMKMIAVFTTPLLIRAAAPGVGGGAGRRFFKPNGARLARRGSAA